LFQLLMRPRSLEGRMNASRARRNTTAATGRRMATHSAGGYEENRGPQIFLLRNESLRQLIYLGIN
jgi:hypothetical protein